MRFYAKKAAALGFLVFLGLWVVAAIRGMTLPFPPPSPVLFSSYAEDAFSGRSGASNQNYWNNLKEIGMEKTPLPMVIDQGAIERIQVHEKTANMTAVSAAFEDDETKIRAALATYQAGITSEKSSGIAPQRRLAVELGVSPEKFDSLVADLRTVGTLASIRIEQTDRTSEFRKLHALRQSLKKYLASVQKLRDADKLSLDDALRLDQKIKEIENELRPLGDQLGDFLGKESFYRVQLTLSEHQPGDRRDHTYTTPQRIWHAFLWACVWWFAVALAASIVAATGVSIWTLRQKAPM